MEWSVTSPKPDSRGQFGVGGARRHWTYGGKLAESKRFEQWPTFWRRFIHYGFIVNLVYEWLKAPSVTGLTTYLNAVGLISALMLTVAFSFLIAVEWDETQQCIDRFGSTSTSWACSSPHCTHHFPKDANGVVQNPYASGSDHAGYRGAVFWAFLDRFEHNTASIAFLSASLISDVLLLFVLSVVDLPHYEGEGSEKKTGAYIKLWVWIRWVCLLILICCVWGIVETFITARDLVVLKFPDFEVEKRGSFETSASNRHTFEDAVYYVTVFTIGFTLAMSSVGLAHKNHSMRSNAKLLLDSSFPMDPHLTLWASWTHQDVSAFFKRLKGDHWTLLVSNSMLFEKHQIAGRFLPQLTLVDLECMGIASVGVRMQIAESIKAILHVADLMADGYLSVEEVLGHRDTEEKPDETVETQFLAPAAIEATPTVSTQGGSPRTPHVRSPSDHASQNLVVPSQVGFCLDTAPQSFEMKSCSTGKSGTSNQQHVGFCLDTAPQSSEMKSCSTGKSGTSNQQLETPLSSARHNSEAGSLKKAPSKGKGKHKRRDPQNQNVDVSPRVMVPSQAEVPYF